MKIKKIVLLILIISAALMLQPNSVQAGLQANGNDPASKNRNTWMEEVRKMESLGGTLGLVETQNDDLTSSSGSNSLDIHLQKNTEYGAMALLSASSYGKPDKIGNEETTTGNETGVVIPYHNEWTAAQSTLFIGKTAYADRYINYYEVSGERKNGDAMIETGGWHGSVSLLSTDWNGAYPGGGTPLCAPGSGVSGGIARLLGSGIFGYSNRWKCQGGWHGTIGYGPAYYWNTEVDLSYAYYARAVIINGENI